MTHEVCLTGDELMAVARSFGGTRFPGVVDSMYDATKPEHHDWLDQRFLACLVARGLVMADADGRLYPAGPLASILAVVASHRSYVAVEQLEPAHATPIRNCSLMTGSRGTVRHWMEEPLHVLELVSDDPDRTPDQLHLIGVNDSTLRTQLSRLVDASPGAGRARRRRWRGTRSKLHEFIPPPDMGWRKVTVLARSDRAKRGVVIEGFLAVFDGGPDDLWLVSEDDSFDDPAEPAELLNRAVVAEPASYTGVQEALLAFATTLGFA